MEGVCVLWGTRVIVPKKLQGRVLDELHCNHLGMSRMKSLARSYVWWPGLDQEIEEIAKGCTSCQGMKDLPAVAPLHPWNWPAKAWQRVHVDFAGPFQGRMYLIMVDAHSKWPEMIEMGSTTAKSTIAVLRQVFASHGLPLQLVTDNGPQFVSNDFKQYLEANGVKHIHCAPYHPASNGLAERFVKTFKTAMLIAERQGTPQELRLPNFLLSYRSTPHATTNRTPSSLFLQRELRTRLDLLRPSCADHVTQQQAQQSCYHDSHARTREFSVDQDVWAKNFRSGPKWSPGVVVKRNGPLSYTVRLSSGVCWNRHIDHLRNRLATEDLPESSEHDSEAFTELPSTLSHSENEHMPANVDNPPIPCTD